MGDESIHIVEVLVGINNGVDCRLTGRKLWRGRDGVVVYLLLEDAMVEAGLQEVYSYVYRCQNMAV